MLWIRTARPPTLHKRCVQPCGIIFGTAPYIMRARRRFPVQSYPQPARCNTFVSPIPTHIELPRSGARVRSLRAASALRQWGDNVRNRAALDQK